MDPLGEFVATIGCDGMLHLYRMPQDEEQTPEFIKKVKVSTQKVQPFGSNNHEMVWSHDGNELLITGDLLLKKMARNTWELTSLKEFGHKKETTCVAWISEDILVTAGLDQVIKVWDYSQKTLLHYYQHQ
jgi:WD40 repeat protein